MKIPVLEMAQGVVVGCKFEFTCKLREQLADFIRTGGMRDWLRRAGEQIDQSRIPSEMRHLLRCSPTFRYEILDGLLSDSRVWQLRHTCVEQNVVEAWEFSDFGKAVMGWATVCLLNPIQEEAIDRCVLPMYRRKSQLCRHAFRC